MLDSVGSLPIHRILSFLDPDGLSSLAQCSKFFFNSVNVNIYWKRFCVEKKWTKYGSIQSDSKSLIESSLSNGVSAFASIDLNHESEELRDLNALCFWWQVFLRALHLQRNWRRGKYSVQSVKIEEHGGSAKVTAMGCNDSFLIIGTSDKILLLYKLYSWARLATVTVSDCITSVSVTADRILIGLANGNVHRHDCPEITNWTELYGLSHPIWGVLEIGDRVCAIYSNKHICVWSLSSNSLLYTLSGHNDEIFCYCFFTERWLFTGSWDCSAMVWDIENGFLAAQLSDHVEAVSCLKVNNDYLVTGCFDGNVRIWNWQLSLLINTLEGSKEIYCLEISDSKILAAGSDSCIYVWNWDGCQLFKLAGHLGIIRHIKLLDDSRLVSAGDMRRIMVWNINKGSCENVLYRNALQIGKFLATDFCVVVASDSSTPYIGVLSFI